MGRGVVGLLAGAYVALRLLLATTTCDPNDDVQQFKYWSLILAHDGLGRVYETPFYDYPPLYSYFLTPIGRLYTHLHPGVTSRLNDPDALARLDDSTFFTVVVKLPPLLFDLAIAALLALLARRSDPQETGGARSIPWLAAAAYLLNPAVLFNAGYWGQPDSVVAFFVLAAFAALGGGRRRAWLAWPLLALACTMKPLGAPFVPLLLVASLFLHGWRTTLLGALAGAGAALLVYAPCLLASGASRVAARLLRDVGVMGFTSVQAHNFWWIVGPWKNADAPWLGPITAKQVGLVLFAAFLVGLCVRLVRVARARRAGLDRSQLLLLAGALALGFFMLATHMHENHAFAAIPLLIGALATAPAGNSARTELRLLVGAVSIGILVNLVAHDPRLHQLWPLSAGGVADLAVDTPDHPLNVGEYVVGWLGTLWNVAALAALGAFTFGSGLLRLAWRTPAAKAESVEA